MESDHGYALLETVVSLAILALVASICFPRAGAQSALSIGLLRTAAAAGTLLREDRNAALAGGRSVAAEIDLAGGSIRSGATGERLILSEFLRSEAWIGGRRGQHGLLTFFPDGRSSGGSIDLAYDTSTYRITINPQTSAVTILRLPDGAKTPARS